MQALTLAGPVGKSPPTAQPIQLGTLTQLTEDEIRDRTRMITVRVFSGDPQNGVEISGSGILLDRQDPTSDQPSYLYLVLSNAHVKSSANEYYVQTPDGWLHKALPHPEAKQKFGDNDLGLLWFSSGYHYEKAVIGKSSDLKTEDKVFVVGFPCELTSPSMACPAEFTFTSGAVYLINKPLVNGYQLGYTNETKEGMSGGAVMDVAGRLVGINGRGKYPPGNRQYTFADGSGSPPEVQNLMRYLALGIPIETYLTLAPKQLFAKIKSPTIETTYTLRHQEQNNNLTLIISGMTGILILTILLGYLLWSKYKSRIRNEKTYQYLGQIFIDQSNQKVEFIVNENNKTILISNKPQDNKYNRFIERDIGGIKILIDSSEIFWGNNRLKPKATSFNKSFKLKLVDRQNPKHWILYKKKESQEDLVMIKFDNY
ncbi:serine protease [Coleofasciculus sp. FACHB-1120]|uniref:S1 family peptidase n=1 Tax=Coleofasciculus sp. FACHB-1120 TaxID=2692783 RepID=UPI0016879893|nr:serine protease [Coleofasciculus sp. FACHB-1120]MBD2740638.1 trypsin-like peptidase domain-containing protein [Coleofasciculus sp. FACHB-1120]